MNASQPLVGTGVNRWTARLRPIGTTRWSFLARPTVLGIVLIATAFLVHLPTLDQPLLETQNWRFMFRGSVEADELARFRGLGYRILFYCPTDSGSCELTKLGH